MQKILFCLPNHFFCEASTYYLILIDVMHCSAHYLPRFTSRLVDAKPGTVQLACIMLSASEKQVIRKQLDAF